MANLLLLLFIKVAHAVDPPPPPPPQVTPYIPAATNISTDTLITGLYGQIFNLITLLAGAAATIYLVWAGIQYITSNGSPEKAKQARNAIINAIIGIIIIGSAYAIIRISLSIASSFNSAVK